MPLQRSSVHVRLLGLCVRAVERWCTHYVSKNEVKLFPLRGGSCQTVALSRFL